MHILIKYLCTMACMSAIPLACSEHKTAFASRMSLLPTPPERVFTPSPNPNNKSGLLLGEAAEAALEQRNEALKTKYKAEEERNRALASLQEALATLERSSKQTDLARRYQEAANKERDLAIEARQRAEQTIDQLKEAVQAQKVELSAALKKIDQLELEKKTAEDTTIWAVESRKRATKTIVHLETEVIRKRNFELAEAIKTRDLALQEKDTALRTIAKLEADKKTMGDTIAQQNATIEAFKADLETRALALSHQKRSDRRKASSGSAPNVGPKPKAQSPKTTSKQ